MHDRKIANDGFVEDCISRPLRPVEGGLVVLPDDEEVERWSLENLEDDSVLPEINKFRLWLRGRVAGSEKKFRTASPVNKKDDGAHAVLYGVIDMFVAPNYLKWNVDTFGVVEATHPNTGYHLRVLCGVDSCSYDISGTDRGAGTLVYFDGHDSLHDQLRSIFTDWGPVANKKNDDPSGGRTKLLNGAEKKDPVPEDPCPNYESDSDRSFVGDVLDHADFEKLRHSWAVNPFDFREFIIKEVTMSRSFYWTSIILAALISFVVALMIK